MSVILFCDDEKRMLELMKMHFSHRYEVLLASDGFEALNLITTKKVDLVVTDVKMPKLDGMELLKKVKELSDVPVIMVTAFGSIENAVDAIKAGAYDYVTKPLNLRDLELKISRALDYISLKRENVELKNRVMKSKSSGIITANQKMMEILKKIPEYAEKDLPILILGESGTGKELVAREIHARSKRYLKPFVAVNVSAIPEDLFESEFFGYEKGAFSGAITSKKGKFEAADKGTLFLDEIGDMRIEHQAKLLRVLQELKVTPLGSVKEIPVDFRLVCATNKDLESMVRKGEFRQDLYYRLNVVRIEIPPLRERPEDVEVLINFYLEKYANKFSEKKKHISLQALKVLKSYTWPGNVRELENVVLRALLNASGEEIGVKDLPQEVKNVNEFMNYKEFLARKRAEKERVSMELQRRFVAKLMEKSGGNVTKAARIAGMDRRLLQRLIKEVENWQYLF